MRIKLEFKIDTQPSLANEALCTRLNKFYSKENLKKYYVSKRLVVSSVFLGHESFNCLI